ncbi:MAG: IS1595 family transposase [Proteobacteria bacterium]|nr:IS1595 family transposase [Pseudomonadota bacterium]
MEFLEKHRWGDHPACPKCGDMDVYKMKSMDGSREKHYRWRCHGCNAQYTVRVGTVFEDSRAPLRHWCFAFWRASTSKKGVSALEIHRQTGLSYKSSLFLLHRIRYAMAPDPTNDGPLSGIVEIDETFIGGKPRKHRSPRKAWSNKQPVMAMVERGGRAKAVVVPDVTAKTLKAAIRESVDPKAWIHTDEHKGYTGLSDEFGDHQTVNHSAGEYVQDGVTTNTVEGFFSIVKRGLNGIYHSVSKKHLQLYLNEYSFRYSNRAMDDGERVIAAIRAADGKKLYYKEPLKV